MKIKVGKLIGLLFLLISFVIVSYLCYQNYNSAKGVPKKAKFVLNLE